MPISKPRRRVKPQAVFRGRASGVHYIPCKVPRGPELVNGGVLETSMESVG